MKTLFKKTLKYSCGALATYKAGDTLLAYTNLNIRQNPAHAASTTEEEDKKLADYVKLQNDDIIAALLKKEFDGDLSKADP